MRSTLPVPGPGPKGCFRRNLVIAGRSGEGLLTEPTAAAQPWRWELVFMPHFRHWRVLGDGAQRPQSNALWASFDDTEGRWGSRERHIEGGYRLGETFQCQAAEVFECHYFLYSTAAATRPAIRIWPFFASAQSRAARLHTVPIAV